MSGLPTRPRRGALVRPFMTFLYRRSCLHLDFIWRFDDLAGWGIASLKATSDHVVPSASAEIARRPAAPHGASGHCDAGPFVGGARSGPRALRDAAPPGRC